MNGSRTGVADPCHDFTAAQWEAVRDEVSGLANLGPNWDGEGGLPAQPGLLEAALRFLCQLEEYENPPPVDAYLAPDGTIVAEWHGEGGLRIIANVRAPAEAELTYRWTGKKPVFRTAPILPPAATVPPVPSRGSYEPVSFYDEGAYELAW